jgi:hypothetical protein
MGQLDQFKTGRVTLPARRLTRQPQRDGGASAVEFALVAPILFMLLFGILEYGFYFNDSISLRQGVREAARQAVVQKSAASCSGALGQATSCTAADASHTLISNPAFKVYAIGGWSRGNELVVCGAFKHSSLSSFVPFPNGGNVRTRTTMSIEVDNPVPAAPAHAGADPSGQGWSWC